ncbi:hypothetical protein [Haloarchaeobius litoreus]|uniref:Uncharacterized protein n=1 Tax=Haloarchaeobius litoreus TaxID=755306 RepID=A0ABD6DDM2_9EURY|nr:hypothetical protein [Haloarchaeobius litoreus]
MGRDRWPAGRSPVPAADCRWARETADAAPTNTVARAAAGVVVHGRYPGNLLADSNDVSSRE